MELAGERGSLEERFRLPVLPAPVPLARLVVLRDPFGTSAPSVPAVQGGPDVDLSDPLLLPLPPNRGAAENVPAAVFGSAAPLVRAVITGGDSPRALIDENGEVRIVEIGDNVRGSKITVIDSDGIRLRNGTHYPVSGENV